ncbi:MAG TPA: alkaline phosphatase family protein [Thermoanaerobaculia bacterium]|nr:alkaline phosphatase family protein [Thermoanaerobaculia bacterium]
MLNAEYGKNSRIALRVSIISFLSAFCIQHSALSSPPRVIVLGFDGVDARYTERWMNEGKLPNLAKLRASGTYRPLRPTVPPQTPVSWSTFSTGIDPGRTGIFDFLRRDPKTYLPEFAAFDETVEPFFFGGRNKLIAAAAGFALTLLIVVAALWWTRTGRAVLFGAASVLAVGAAFGAYRWTEKNLPLTRPGVVNRREGIPMWEVAGRAGLKSQVVHVPVTFPAKDYSGGHMLAGLGVPDISARVGKPFYFTSELDFHKGGANEFSIEVVQLEDNRGVIETKVVGPPNKLFKDPPFISQPMTITVREDRKSIAIALGGKSFALQPGQWSDWAEFTFAFNSVIKLKGVSRFYLLQSQPEVKLYLSPINFDPRALPPGFDISAPSGWAPELAEKLGLYKTMGWAIDTWAISEGFANEQMFWDDMTWTVAQYRKMFRDFLKTDDALFIQCFEFPDRVGHVLWRLVDPEHPAYDAALAAKWGDGLLRSYQLMDDIVGEAMAAATSRKAALIVMSDHGFSTWRKSVNYNTWLVQNGYLALKSGVEAKPRTVEILFDQGQFWENVDWSRSRAYALGLGDLYINLAGREAQGTVRPGQEYESLKLELKERLEAMVDPETNQRPVSRVFLREHIYKKFDPNVIPDLIITNSEGYRVSWQTSLGGIQKELFETNKRTWSGDHCSLDPEIVKGIFFYNRKMTSDRAPYIADIYPTVLDLLGLKAPYELDGEILR